MSDLFDPYYTWLGIPPEEQPADYYRLLGVRRFESNSEVLVNAADQRMAYLRTFQAGKRAAHSQKLLNEVSAAQVCLLDTAKKRAYDERLSRESAAREGPSQPAAVVPVARSGPVTQALPRAQPIQPLVTTPIAPATTFPRPEAPHPAPLFAQPLVTLSASAHPLQPAVKPKLALPASPVVLVVVSSAAALVLLVMGGLIWASWPRAKPEIVLENKNEEGTGQQPTIVVPPEHPDVRPPSPPVESGQPPITLVDVPSSAPPASPAGRLAVAPFTPDEAQALQKEAAERLGKPVEETNTFGMKLRLIPPGKFRMGWTSQRLPQPAGQLPVVEKEIAEAFYLGECEVTVGQFRRFVTDSGYKTDAERNGRGVGVWDADLRRDVFKPEYTWQTLPYPTADDHPVGGVSWNDAQAFCRWLSSKELRNYRLPAEAQWEFACRAGSEGAWFFGDDPAEQEKYGWFFPTKGSRPVGSKLPNGFGLFDMHGSASEWCADRMASSDRAKDYRVFRGGSINTEPARTSSAYRHGHERDSAWNALGFRVALPASAVSPQPGTLAGTAKSTAAANTTVPLLDPASVRYAVRFETGSGPMWARFTPDGKQVSFGTLGDSTSGSYATDGSGSSGQLSIPSPVFALSSDGSMLAKAQRSAQQSDMIQVDRISTGGRSSPVAGSGIRLRGKAKALAFSEDRRILFAACGATEKLLALSVFKNLEPIPAFRSNLADVAWLDARGDTLVCLDANGAGEVHSIRGRRILQTLKVPGFPNSPAVLLEPAPLKLSLLVFAPEQAVVQQLTGSKTLDRFPLPGLTTSANLLAISAAGDLVVLRDPAGIVIWNIAQNKAVTRIDVSHSLRFCAIHSQPSLLAFEAPDAQLFLCDLARLLAQPRWILPSGAGWNAAYPASRGSITLSKTDLPLGPADAPPPNRFPGPLQPPKDDAAGRAAIVALRAKGFELSDAPATVYSVQASGLKLDAEVGRLLTQLPAIVHLSFESATSVGDFLKSLVPLPKVGTLRLNRSDVTDEDLAHLAKLSGLQYLDLNETKVSAAGLAHLKALPNLNHVELPLGLTREAVAPLSQLTRLEHVTNWPSGITDDDLPQLGKLTNLLGLELGSSQITGDVLRHLQGLKRLERLSVPPHTALDSLVQLKAFNLKSFSLPQGSGDREVGYLAHMTNLELFWTPPDVTDAGIKILAQLPALHTVYMSANSRITSAGLAPLAALPKLEGIDLPQRIDDEGLRVLKGSTSLRRLSLHGTEITNRGLVHLAAMPVLESVGLPERVTDDGLVHLQQVAKLKDVKFHNSAITTEGIASLKNCRRLESVSFTDMKLTDADIASLSKLTGLKQLLIQEFKLTDEQLQKLKQGLPNCHVGNW